MICVALMHENPDEVLRLLQQTEELELAEIRLDGIRLRPGDVAHLFGTPVATVATCRPTPDRTEPERAALLMAAIDAGAHWVDIEIESDAAFRNPIISRAREKGRRVIVSYHNFNDTPSAAQLRDIVDTCFQFGADCAKVACAVHSPAQAARLLGLMDSDRPVLALGMGAAGRITRIAAPFLGAPFTFAARDESSATAPGQYPVARLKKIYTEIGDM